MYYFEKDSYAVNYHTGVFDQTHGVPIRSISTYVKKTKVKTMATTNNSVNMSLLVATIMKKPTTATTVATNTIVLDLMLCLKIENHILGKLEVIWRVLRI